MVLSVLIINEHNSIYFPNELFMVSNNELSTCAMRLGCWGAATTGATAVGAAATGTGAVAAGAGAWAAGAGAAAAGAAAAGAGAGVAAGAGADLAWAAGGGEAARPRLGILIVLFV